MCFLSQNYYLNESIKPGLLIQNQTWLSRGGVKKSQIRPTGLYSNCNDIGGIKKVSSLWGTVNVLMLKFFFFYNEFQKMFNCAEREEYLVCFIS